MGDFDLDVSRISICLLDSCSRRIWCSSASGYLLDARTSIVLLSRYCWPSCRCSCCLLRKHGVSSNFRRFMLTSRILAGVDILASRSGASDLGITSKEEGTAVSDVAAVLASMACCGGANNFFSSHNRESSAPCCSCEFFGRVCPPEVADSTGKNFIKSGCDTECLGLSATSALWGENPCLLFISLLEIVSPFKSISLMSIFDREVEELEMT